MTNTSFIVNKSTVIVSDNCANKISSIFFFHIINRFEKYADHCLQPLYTQIKV